MQRMVLLALMVTALAGCLSGDEPTEPDQPTDTQTGAVPFSQEELDTFIATSESGPAWQPMVAVADIDTGVNPYHVEFRDHSPRAYIHPSVYLPGYSPDVPALWLTLDEPDYATAVRADCAVWSNITAATQYWIPGTRIVSAITFGPGSTDCDDTTLPGAILDRGGHGTMTTSRVAGSESSLCPMCLIASIQGFSDQSMIWAANQPWIDAQTNSWGDLPTGYAGAVYTKAPLLPVDENDRAAVIDLAAKQATFVAGGNGLAGFFGVTGHPAQFDNIAGPQGIIMVGGHDNGYYTPWTMTLPHIVADANAHPSALFNQVSNRSETGGGGTSGATPFATGTFARAIWEARLAMDDHGIGYRDGNIVVAGPEATLPASGPLADGLLSLDEAKTALYRTANPRPVEDGHWDGPKCTGADCIVDGLGIYATVPVEWSTVPEELPMYYYVGYGQVGNVTLNHLVDVLLGDEPMPERPVEDQFYTADTQVRELFDLPHEL